MTFFWMKEYFFFLGKWTKHTTCFTKVNLIRTWQNFWQHVQRKNLFLTLSKNSRFYVPVSPRNSGWFINADMIEKKIQPFFSEISILFEVIFLFICWWFPNDLKRKCVTDFAINYLWICRKSEEREAKERDFGSLLFTFKFSKLLEI